MRATFGRVSRLGSNGPIDPEQLDRGYEQIVQRCLGVGDGDDVLIVMDPERRGIAGGLAQAVRDVGGEPIVTVVLPNPARGTEPPAAVAAALREVDAFLAPCLPSLSHTSARKEASALGIRGATLPGATLGMIARLMTADLDLVARRSQLVADLLSASGTAQITCPAGSDLRVDLRGRDGIVDDGDLRAPGAFGNLPCGEGFISPAGAEGTIVASVVPTYGVLEQPIVLEVAGGSLSGASGGPPGAADAFLAALDAHGELGRNVAELGVGTNDNALLTGNILEDEKRLGTVHVAFGASAGIGGTVSVPVHLDVIIERPTLTIDGTAVIAGGHWVLED